MASGAPGAYTNNPTIFNPNDKFFLGQPWLDNAEYNYGAYISSGIIGDWANIQYVNNIFPPWYIWGKGLSPSYGFYFDRDDASADLAANSGLIPGKTVGTKGIYNVSITYHNINGVTGVMFATINGVQQGFFGTSPLTGKPQFIPVGKLYNGAQDWAQVYVDLKGDPDNPANGVKIYNFKATGTPRAPAVYGVDPPSAEQGDVLDAARVNGESFRDNAGISVDFLKMNATNDGDTLEVFSANPVTYYTSKTVLAHLVIPDEATPGPWNVTYKHSDDNVVARMNNAFTVYRAPPKITSISVNHAKRNQKISMNINGKFFRNVGLTVQLKRGAELINGTNVKWKSKNLITADFTIPTTATIGADWSVFVQHNDDGKSSTSWFTFSVDAKVVISPVVIWLRAPGFTTVNIYSESGFDATTVIPLSVSLGGVLPFWSTKLDLNWDGKKDLQLHYYNGFVTIPTGFVTEVAVAGRTSSWVPIKGYTSVTCFKFLF